MKKTITTLTAIALVAMLAFPLAAPAKGRPASPGKSAAKEARKADQAAAKETHTAEKAEKKTEKKAEKSLRKEAHQEQKRTREEARAAEGSEDASGTSDVATVAPSVSNSFVHITTNLEKSLAKIAAGKKKQLPPGLVRVWLKFASWLGVDPTTMPGTTSDSPAPPTGETTPTAEPTGTVAPVTTQPPTSTVDGSVLSAP